MTQIIPELVHALAVHYSGVPHTNRIFSFPVRLGRIEYYQSTHSIKHYNNQVAGNSETAASVQCFRCGIQKFPPNCGRSVNADKLFTSYVPSPEFFDQATIRRRKRDTQFALGGGYHLYIAAVGMVRNVLIPVN